MRLVNSDNELTGRIFYVLIIEFGIMVVLMTVIVGHEKEAI